MDNPEPRAQYLNVVLRQIERTSLRIPRFQRHFVWGERDVLELLGSIQKGYPMGSILTWKVEASDDYFSGYREDPFPTVGESTGNFEVILDGAQRLSSLYGCLRNSGSNPIYNVVYDLRSGSFAHVASLTSLEAWHVPMDALFDSRRFLAVQAKIDELDDGEALLPLALDLYSTFQDYQIPIIALSNAVLEDVVEVFRRVNSSGTPLSSVDFVRALTWRSSFDLEETFESFAERYFDSPLSGFSEEFLVRCLAVSAGLSLDSRDILQLKDLSNRDGGLSTDIEEMQDALDAMADFLVQLDISRIREVPYEVQRLLLFGFMRYAPDTDPKRIQDWFWRSTFAEEHQSKPESYVSRLIAELRNGNVEPALEIRKPIDPYLFASRIRRGGSAVATGFDLLLRRNGTRSLLSGEAVSGSSATQSFLFSRRELSVENVGRSPQTGLLANLVWLTEDDAAEWHELRRPRDLRSLFDLCQERTGEASQIWATQGILTLDDASPASILNDRSRGLLRQVVPEI